MSVIKYSFLQRHKWTIPTIHTHAPWYTAVFYYLLCNFFLKILFFLFLPKAPPVHSCIFLVVGPSSCGTWDAAPAWLDEQCHVGAQDGNRRNSGLPRRARTWPLGHGAGPWLLTLKPLRALLIIYIYHCLKLTPEFYNPLCPRTSFWLWKNYLS